MTVLERLRLRRPIPLRLVLVFPFMLLTVGTVGLVGYLCIQNGQKAVTDLANQLMTETGDRVNLYLTDYLETPQLVNRLNANAVQLNQIDITNPESLKRHFVQQIQAFNSVSRIHFSNPQGGYLSTGNDERGFSVATTSNFVKGTLQVYGVDQQGNRRELLVERPNYDASQRPFYLHAIEAGKPVWTPIYVYVPSTRGLGISASYPLYNQQRQLQGVLSSDLTLADISKFLADLRVGTNGTVFIVDRSGLMVASSTPEKPFFTRLNSDVTERLKAIDSQATQVRLSTQHLMAQFGDLSKINNAEQLQFDIDGKRQFLQVMPFEDEPGLDWLIVVTVPEANFMGRIHSNTRDTIVLSLVALAGATLLGIWLARWIARPIQRLSRASQALAAGAWQESLQASSPIAELQVLAHAFNQTSVQLQQAFERVKTALQASEEKFTTIFRTCPDPIGIITLDGRYLEVNEAFINLFGYSREEIIGRKVGEIGQWINVGDQQRYKRLVKTGERIYNQEYTLKKRSGEWVTLLFSAENIHLEGRQCILSIAKEITDRKQIENSLRQQADREQLLRTITQRVRQSLNLDEILTAAVTEVRQTLKADRVLIFHLTSEGSGIVLKESVVSEYPVTQAMLWEDECFTNECYEYYQQGEPRIVLDVAVDHWADCLIEFMQAVGVKSKMVAPIIQDTEDGSIRVWGLLIVHACAEYRQWQPNEAELLQQIANQLAIALQQANLYQQVQIELADRKRVEAALRQSEERNRAVLSAMPDLMALISAEGIYLDIVRSNVQLDLIPADIDPIGKHLTEVMPTEIAVAKLQLIQRTLATGEMQTLEQQFRLNDRWQHEEVRAVPCGGDAVLVMIRDITDRKQAEAALLRSEERNRAILSAIPDLMTLVSADGIYLSSVRSNALIDLVPSSVNPIGKHLTEMLPAEVAATQLRLIESALATGGVQTAEQRLWMEGRWQYEELRVAPCGSDAALVMIRDITDRKQAELALIESRDLREAIFNGSADAIFLVELPPSSRIIDCNQRAVELFQVESKAELIGINSNTLKKQPLTSEDLENIALAMEQIGLWSREIEYVTRSGRVFWGDLAIKKIQVGDQAMWLVRVTDVTAQKRIEEALRQSEQLFRGAFETSAFGISIRSPEGKYLRVNQALCRMLGYTEPELLQASYKDITHPDDLAIDPDNTTKKLLSGEISYYHLEKRFIHKEGHTVWGLVSISLVRDLQQQPLYLVAQIQDITDRKLAQEALRQSEARFQKIAAASPAQIYILVCNANGSNLRFEYISSGVREIQELEPEQVLQDAMLTYLQVHPDDRSLYNQITYRSFTTLEPFSHEWRIITPSGKVKWVQANSRPERRDNGDIAWYGVLLDITRHKEAEEALRQNEARLQQLADASPAIIYTIEEYPTGPVRFEFLSPAFEEIHEIPLDEALQDPMVVFNCFHPDDREGHRQAVARAAATMQAFKHTWRIITPSGKIKWIQGSSRPERRENGVLVWHGVVQDITELKQAEEALRQSEATLRRAQIVAHVGSWQVEVHTGKVTWTEESFHIMGWDLAQPEPSLSQFYDLIHPEDRALLRQQVEFVIAHQTSYKVEFRVVHPDGSLHYVEARGEVVVNEAGQTTHLIGTNLDITERKQAEEALRYSEATKNQILKAIPDLILWMTADGTCMDLIDGHNTTNLYIKSEAIGKNLYQMLPFDLAKARMNAIQQALQTGEAQVYEQQVSFGAEIHHEEVRVIGVGEDRVLVIVRDITDRKRAEAALEAQRSFLRQVLDVIPNPVFVKDLEGRFIIANQAIATIHGVPVEELTGKRVTDLSPYVDANLAEQFLADNREVMMTRQPKHGLPYQIVTASGERRWYQTIVSSFIDAEGQVQGVVGNSVDITGLKQVEEALQQQNQALRESEERFRSAFWDAPIGMALIGLNDRWLKVNPMLCDMLGFAEAELLSTTASSLVHPDDLAKVQQCIQQVLSNENRSVQVELRYCCQQGHIVWGLMSLSLVRNAEAQPLYYVAQIQDITERQAIDRMKNEFISIVSHELRTPLTAIRGFLGLLDTGIYDNRPEKAKHMIGQALSNSNRLVRLVNDILDLERLSSGKVQLTKEACCAEELMQRAAAGVQSIADQVNIHLVVVPATVQVLADLDSIIQTLTNLLSNAIKFSPPHSVVTLSAQAQTDSVLFSVRDQGRGIPADKIETIFGRFQQVDVSDSRQKGGTGLGLAICQSIVQQHGGSIWAESTFGEGSIFYFTLPLLPGEER